MLDLGGAPVGGLGASAQCVLSIFSAVEEGSSSPFSSKSSMKVTTDVMLSSAPSFTPCIQTLSWHETGVFPEFS